MVVFGLFLGFQVDRWYEGQKDLQLEKTCLERLKGDMLREIEQFDEANNWAEEPIDSALLLERVMETPELALEQPLLFINSLETSGWTSFPQISRFVYTEMQNSGNFMLLRSESLRRAIADHYANLDHAERYALQRNELQIAYELDVTGVLSTRALVAIEEETMDSLIFTEQELLDIVQTFSQRGQTVSLIPELVQHHVFNLELNYRGKSEAIQIIKQIDELLESGN